jgi:hypothetical protein
MHKSKRSFDKHSREWDDKTLKALPTNVYQYESLNQESKEIRLMTLKAGSTRDPIFVILENVPFVTDGMLQQQISEFEALSYTWGSPENPARIAVSSKKSGTGSLAITQNLAEALPFLRHHDKDRLLWIDAICVNQGDLDERSSQVVRMGDIYSHATLVLVWLGPENDDSGRALALLDSLSDKITVDWGLYQVLLRSVEHQQWADLKKPLPFSEIDWLAISHLYSRPWFDRLWVQQEIRLSKSALLICGRSTLAWNLFRDAVYVCSTKASSSEHNLVLQQDWCYDSYAKLHDMVKDCNPGYVGLHKWPRLLYQTRKCQSSDPKDQIFAVLSLSNAREQKMWKFEPDYNKSVAQIYIEASTTYLQSLQDLDMLRYCGVGRMQRQLDLPSWVVDCAALKSSPKPLRSWDAHGGTMCKIQFESSNVLHVEGLLVDSVKTSISFTFHTASCYDEIARGIQRVSLGILSQEDISSSLNLISRAVLAGRFQDSYEPPLLFLPTQHEAQESLEKTLRCTVAEAKLPISGLVNEKVLIEAAENCSFRSLMRLDNGKIGLAPAATKPGDCVVVLLGCSNPLVLRPVGEAHDSFQIVGECYVDSIMAGETVLGSLPKSVQIVFKQNEQRGRFGFAFRGNETGSIVIERSHDPRYELLLGEDWRERPEYRDFDGDAESYSEKVKRDCMKARGVRTREFRIV